MGGAWILGILRVWEGVRVVRSPLSVFGWKWGGGGAKGWGMLVEVAENPTFLALAGDLIVKSNPTAKSQPCFAATYDKSR